MPNWKKIIVSGSDATLSSLIVTNEVTASSYTGSFSGSFSGDGRNLINIDAFPFTGSAEILGDLSLYSEGNDYVEGDPDGQYVDNYIVGGTALYVNDNAVFSGSVDAASITGSLSGSFEGNISVEQLRVNSPNDYVEDYIDNYVGGISLITTGSIIIEGGADITGPVYHSLGTFVLTEVSESLNFTNDIEASNGGVPLGGLYRDGNNIKIRIT
jgi:hypothetical protein